MADVYWGVRHNPDAIRAILLRRHEFLLCINYDLVPEKDKMLEEIIDKQPSSIEFIAANYTLYDTLAWYHPMPQFLTLSSGSDSTNFISSVSVPKQTDDAVVFDKNHAGVP